MVPITTNNGPTCTYVATGGKVIHMRSYAHPPLCNRPNHPMVDCHMHFVRLTVTDRVCKWSVCMWIFALFAKFRTDGDACRHDVCICVCLFFLIEYWQWASIFVHTIKWSRMVEQLRPILCQVCIFAMQGTGNVCWISPCVWLRVIASLSLVWDESRCYQLAITLFWFHTCI